MPSPRSSTVFARARRRAQLRLDALARAAVAGGVAFSVAGAPAAAPAPAVPTSDDAHRVASDRAWLALAGPVHLAGQLPTPRFGPAQVSPFGLSALPGTLSAPTTADLDSDGDLDLLAGDNYGDFVYFQNTAGAGNTPAYAAGQTNPFGLASIPSYASPTFADLDADGDLDVLAGSGPRSFYYFENVGTAASPMFLSRPVNPFGLTDPSTSFSAPAAGDLDGDGDLDLLVGLANGGFDYYQNTAAPGNPATFAARTSNPFGLASGPAASAVNTKPALVDLDGDGDLDILSGDQTGDFVYFENSGTPTVPTFQPFNVQTNPFELTGLSSFSSPAVADLDGDGFLDVLAGDIGGGFTAFAGGAGVSQFVRRTGAANPFGSFDVGDSAAPAVGDLDADGDLDVLSGSSGGDFAYYQNAGTPTAPAFAAPQTNPFGIDTARVAQPRLADLDGDGDLDVLAAVTNRAAFVYFENTGTLTAPQFGPRQEDPFGLTLAYGYGLFHTVADLDGDGDLDVLAGIYPSNTGGPDFVYFRNTPTASGEPDFAQAPLPTGLSRQFASYLLPPDLADLDGDGDLDLLIGAAAIGTNGVQFLENRGGPGSGFAPIFERPQTNPLGLTGASYFQVPTLADLDADGDLDLLSGLPDGTFDYQENTADPVENTVVALAAGAEGWRMLAAPVAPANVDELLGFTHTQGFPNADAQGGVPNVYFYDESLAGADEVGYRAPTSQSEALPLGTGVFAYLYADDDVSQPGTQGGFPKTFRLTGAQTYTPFGWGAAGPGALSYTDTGAPAEDGWNLLGNPFGSWFDWDAVELSGVDAPVYVYDSAIASYRTHSQGVAGAGNLPGGIVRGAQGFWVQASAASPSMLARPGVAGVDGVFRSGAPPVVVGLRLRPADGSALPPAVEAEAFLALGVPGAAEAHDRLDARALASPAPAHVALATDAGGTPLAIDARPALADEATVELSVRAVGAAGAQPMVLDWPGLDLPDGWAVRLVDREAGTETPLTPGASYAFALDGVGARRDAAPVPHPASVAGGTEGRFALVVTPASVVAGEDAPGEASLSQPMPNPARGGARLALALPAPERVRAAVYDALGREVAVVADGELAGTSELRVDTSRLAAGAYVVRVEGETFAETRRLTVVR